MLRGLLAVGFGVAVPWFQGYAVARKKGKKKRKNKRKKQQTQALPPPPPPPPPPPICAQLGGSCTPGQSLCCDDLLCLGIPDKDPGVNFACCKGKGAPCTAVSGECCPGLSCASGICQRVEA
jgi:hypothetical protein